MIRPSKNGKVVWIENGVKNAWFEEIGMEEVCHYDFIFLLEL